LFFALTGWLVCRLCGNREWRLRSQDGLLDLKDRSLLLVGRHHQMVNLLLQARDVNFRPILLVQNNPTTHQTKTQL